MANNTMGPPEPQKPNETETRETDGAVGFGLQARDILPLAAAAAGTAAGLSGQQPTGNGAADFVLSFAFGWLVVWAAQYAHARAVLLSAVFALFFSGLALPAALFAGVGLLGALVVTSWGRLDADSATITSAVACACIALAVLRLPSIGFTGSSSLFAALSIAPILFTGFGALGTRERRGLMWGAGALAVFAIVATVLAVVAALSVRNQVETGITQAEDGVAALQAVDRPTALSLLASSQQNFEAANDRLSGPLTWLARVVPITAQHSRALETASAQGLALARTAERTGTQADVERIRGSNGALDLSIVDAVNSELTAANATLRSAQQSLSNVSSPWLVPQLSSRLAEVQDELRATAADVDLANHATAVLPGILGADELRRYLVLFVQPAESREFGGFVGAYAILEADQGRMELAESGSIANDFGFGEARFTDSSQFPENYVRIGPEINPQNLTSTADLSTIAAAARDFVPQWREDPSFTIDGVLTIDPYALAGLLELSGPISIEGRDQPINADNVVDFLLRDQYLEFDPLERDLRQDTLRVLAGQAFERLFSIEIPGPERLGSLFGPLARADRLGFVTFDDLENAFLDRVLLSADLPQVGSAVDMIGIYGQTATASKLDGYATRSSSYEVTIDPATGQLQGELRVTERNDAPADAGTFVLGRSDVEGPLGLPMSLGSNLVAHGIYTRAEVSNIVVDTSFIAGEATQAYSYWRHPVVFEVPLGGEATMSLSHTWQVQPGRYDVLITAQATTNPADFTLTVRPTEGWRVSGPGVAADGSWTDTLTLDEALGLTFFFDPIG